jgi:hypothetical protein
MSRDELYSPSAPAPGPRIPTHGELLYVFLQGPTRIRCELVDHGEYGVEARILYDDKHHMSHTFAPWHCIPFATPRAAAIHWAEKKRQRMERDEATDAW